MADAMISQFAQAVLGGTSVENQLNASLARLGKAITSIDSSGNVTWAANQVAPSGASAVGAAPGAAGSSTTLSKVVTGIADDAATTIFTITIPNPAATFFCAAMLDVSIMGICGAGGAVSAGESITIATATIGVTRTNGAAAVIGISSLTQTATAAVAGGDQLVAVTLTNVAVAGANSATQTFAIQTTLDDDTGSGTNHICMVLVDTMNAAASGITVA